MPTLTLQKQSCILDRDAKHAPFKIVGAEGHILITDKGKRIFDGTGGAAVACLNQGTPELHRRLDKAQKLQRPIASYVHSMLYCTTSQDAFAEFMIDSTGGKLSRVMFLNSGSEATEAAMKLAVQYHRDKANPEHERINFISRDGSYHGNTRGALSISGHLARRLKFEGTLDPNCYRVPACNAYRQKFPNESDADFVTRKAAELEAKFQELGPTTVAAFMCEPVVGAALGAVPAVPGYLQAMKDVCHKHGALFILDEVMCGMGRCGHLHAWQEEDVVPDIETTGKGLGGGFTAISAMLIHEKIAKAIAEGGGVFHHGHTYQNHPLACVVGLTVQKYIADFDLVANVRELGPYLGLQLQAQLAAHPNVGNVRGKGFFWGVEFVENKVSKEPFRRDLNVAEKVRIEAFERGMSVYPLQGCADDYWSGDAVLLAPSFLLNEQDAAFMAEKLRDVVYAVFSRL